MNRLIMKASNFFVTGLARQMMRWEGMMMHLFFIFFVVKLANLI